MADPEAFEVYPVMRIYDVERAKAFYVGFLGFQVDWEGGMGEGAAYIQISRGNFGLHLSEFHGDGTPGSAVFVRTRDLDTLYAEVMAKGYRFNRPAIEEAPWGGRFFSCIDPFQNKITFHQEE